MFSTDTVSVKRLNSGGGDSSVGKAPNWKLAQCWRRFQSPMRQGIFLPGSTFRVDFLAVSVQLLCAIGFINICVHVRIPNTGSIPSFGHTKILHILIEMGSAVLATAVPYPGKVTQICRKGQRSTKTLKKKKKSPGETKFAIHENIQKFAMHHRTWQQRSPTDWLRTSWPQRWHPVMSWRWRWSYLSCPPIVVTNKTQSTHKGVNWHTKDVTQTQKQRPESPMVTLTGKKK